VNSLVGTITHVNTSEHIIALTFDDGPHPEFTPRLLDILAKHQARATFFMLGENAQRYPDLVSEVAKAGHAIGNHSWDHPSFPLISHQERRKQIHACAQALAPYGQPLFRPPFGNLNLSARLDALLLGYQVVTWNIVGMDWLDYEANWLTDQIMNKIRPGSIILLHDALHDALKPQFFDRTATLTVVEQLLQRLSHSYHFVTVPELLQRGAVKKRYWLREADIAWLSTLERQHS
jgi:peptidoglycan/xylan/chitin deacetylase (PgdA/CDA1 family)